MVDELTPDLSGPAWASLAYVSRLWAFDESTRTKFVSVLRQVKISGEVDKKRSTINLLARAGHIALAQVWPELAETIMFILVQECDATLSPSDVGAVVRTALIATAALENEKAKSILGNFLIELGARLPATARAALRTEILALWHVTAAEGWYLSQAEALSAP